MELDRHGVSRTNRAWIPYLNKDYEIAGLPFSFVLPADIPREVIKKGDHVDD